MKIIEKRWSAVEIEDDTGYRSTVFLQGDKKWKCLRCMRYRCEHAKFVVAEKPELPPAPHMTQEEINDILTY